MDRLRPHTTPTSACVPNRKQLTVGGQRLAPWAPGDGKVPPADTMSPEPLPLQTPCPQSPSLCRHHVPRAPPPADTMSPEPLPPQTPCPQSPSLPGQAPWATCPLTALFSGRGRGGLLGSSGQRHTDGCFGVDVEVARPSSHSQPIRSLHPKPAANLQHPERLWADGVGSERERQRASGLPSNRCYDSKTGKCHKTSVTCFPSVCLLLI